MLWGNSNLASRLAPPPTRIRRRGFECRAAMFCTCGPHPRIDLTQAYLEYHDVCGAEGANDMARRVTRLDCLRACRSHGCFHAVIRGFGPSANVKGAGADVPLSCLSRSSGNVESHIEELFSPEFVLNAAGGVDGVDTSPEADAGSVYDKICNGGLVSATSHRRAIFRGRTAESGDASEAAPEPKLSWEYQRQGRTAETGDPTEAVPELDDISKSWKYLSDYTNALHSVASTIIHTLGVPPGLVLQESSRGTTEGENIDLLRVFRYDAVSSDESLTKLGSSPHSDWGTLTVVWQDGKGGLQTYCHACDRWSDVEACIPERVEENSVSLFVHVGDFLSLATQSRDGVSCPSPRHRVICPTRDNNGEEDYCRRSLVYFSYPPPGISISDAQEQLEGLVAEPRTAGEDKVDLYESYSLLHNQANGSGDGRDSKSAFETYQSIRSTPFDQVIRDKWNQVQRSS